MNGWTRRTLLSVGGALGLGGGAAGARHLQWQSQDFRRIGYPPEPSSPSANQIAWSNWSGIQRAVAEKIAVPADEQELAALIREAKGPVRPVGSGHSFTGLVPTPGIIVDTSRLAGTQALRPRRPDRHLRSGHPTSSSRPTDGGGRIGLAQPAGH